MITLYIVVLFLLQLWRRRLSASQLHIFRVV